MSIITPLLNKITKLTDSFPTKPTSPAIYLHELEIITSFSAYNSFTLILNNKPLIITNTDVLALFLVLTLTDISHYIESACYFKVDESILPTNRFQLIQDRWTFTGNYGNLSFTNATIEEVFLPCFFSTIKTLIVHLNIKQETEKEKLIHYWLDNYLTAFKFNTNLIPILTDCLNTKHPDYETLHKHVTSYINTLI